MDAGTLAVVAEAPLEGETVCAALARYEATLRAAVRELHADMGAFKVGVERRLDEVEQLTGPLVHVVAQLQLENRQLRGQLEALTRRIEALTGTVCDRSALLDTGAAHKPAQCSPDSPAQPVTHMSPASPVTAASPATEGTVPSPGSGPAQGPMAARFSSRATFAVFNKTNSTEREEPIEVDPAPTSPVLENGHQATQEKPVGHEEPKSPITEAPREHPAPVARSRPHLPVTATTKASEPAVRTQEAPASPARAQLPLPTETQSESDSPRLSVMESPAQPAPAVKAWTPSCMKTMGSPRISDRGSSMPSKSVTYSPVIPPSSVPTVDRTMELAGELSFGRGVEKRRELVRSQTLPRTTGAQARRSVFERLDSDPNKTKPLDSKPKLKRSQSFGMSSASSIKQILLEWCRSKTIGYQNIDIQNFSSSWSDGLAFCALVHSFFPTEFDYNVLTAADRRHNFEVAFGTAEVKAGCDRLIEVEDMMVMGRKPDPMCVFTYVQSLYNHLRRFE